MELYVIGTLLGEGVYGRVYKATNISTGQSVAIKEMDVHKIQGLKRITEVGAKKLLDLEATTMSDISNASLHCDDHVICYYDSFYDISPITSLYCFYIVTEFIDGVAFNEYMNKTIEKGILYGLSEIKNMMIQLCLGVKSIHDKGYAHRDIKPENIMRENETGRLVIIDLGLACKFNCFKYEGTPIYSPPDAFDMDTKYGLPVLKLAMKQDIWALGILFYRITNNSRFPYNVKVRNVAELRLSAKSITEARSEYFHEKTNEIIMSMLKYNPTERPDIDTVLNQLEYVPV